MKRKICIVIILLLNIYLSGCALNTKEREMVEEKAAFLMSVRGSETEDGVILNGGDKYLYYDKNLNVLTPLCTRADCNHMSAEACPAILLMNQSTGVVGYYEGFLWFFYEDEGVVTLSRANVDGTDKKDMFQINVGVSAAAECCIYNGSIYMVDEKLDFIKGSELGGITNRIVAIDLESGEVKEITEETEEILQFMGMDDNRLYYGVYGKQKDNSKGYIYCYDCDTEEKTEVCLQKGILNYARVGKGYLAYQILEGEKCKLYIINPETGEERAFVDEKQESTLEMAFQDRFLVEFATGKCYLFDAVRGTETYFTNPEVKDYNFVWSVEGGYLVRLIEDEYITDEYAFLSNEALLQGGEAECLR